MKKKVILFLILCVMPLISNASDKSLVFKWDYPTPPTDLVGFKIYDNKTNTVIADIKDKGALSYSGLVPVVDSNNCWSITAYDATQESPHSIPYCYDLPPEIPLNFRVDVSVTVNITK